MRAAQRAGEILRPTTATDGGGGAAPDAAYAATFASARAFARRAQASADVTQLYLGAAKARVAFEPRVRAFLSARCAGADVRRVDVADGVKSPTRVEEKRLLRCDAPGSADGICDFVRGTVVVGSLDDVRAVLAGALDWADVELAEPEDSFARDPPVGVGRELALYFWFRDDARKHVCELVVRHEALEAVARRIPGHGRFVHAVRYAAALLDYKYRDLTLRGVSRDVMPALGALGPSAVAIADFWRDCGGPRWKNARGWMASPDLGSWHGLTVDELKRISVLKLDRNGLTGRIPESIGLLTGLRYVLLHDNALEGPVPESVGDLERLQELYMDLNQLEGPLPLRLVLMKLRGCQLYLEHNKALSLPPDIGKCGADFLKLNFAECGLVGDLPASLGDLASLELLSLGDNGFAGPIPPSLGNLRCVVELNLSSNCLEGAIPPELGGLEHLKFLDLHENQLSGEIPGELGNATNLERLYLHNNDLTGEVPRALGALIHLKYAYLHNNPLTISPKMPTDAQGELSFRTEGETLTFVAYLRSDEASCACALM